MKPEIVMELMKMLMSSDKQETTISGNNSDKYPIGKKIILRGYNAGVLFGTLISVTDGVYRMKDSRRLYYWKCEKGITLEDVAMNGITDDSKVTTTVPLCDITDTGVSLLIPCSDIAIKSIEDKKDYNPA